MNAPLPKSPPADRVIPLRGEEWPPASLDLDSEIRQAAPAFPLDMLGAFWADYARQTAAAVSAPVDYVATPLLATVGALLGNVRWPAAAATWAEPPIIWAAVVGLPSDSKSPALRQVKKLLHAIEAEMAAGHDDDLRAFEGQKVHAKARRDAWEDRAKSEAKQGGPSIMPTDCVEPVKPERPRVQILDITPESAAAVASQQPRGLLASYDEIATWVGSFGRYNKGGSSDSERAFWIEAYHGEKDRTIDRKSGSLVIPNLTIGVVGGIQPDKLGVLTGGANDGFAARILWAWPDRFPEFAIPRGDDFGLGGAGYERAIARLLRLEQDSSTGKPRPIPVPLAGKAVDMLEAFGRRMRDEGRRGSGVFGAVLGKAAGSALRLAGILEYLWWCASPIGPEPKAITAEAMGAALDLVDEYYLPMARRVLGEAAISDEDRNVLSVYRRVKGDRLLTFNARMLGRELGIQAAEMDAACEELQGHGIVRSAPSRQGGQPGRKAKNYEVNPALWAGTA